MSTIYIVKEMKIGPFFGSSQFVVLERFGDLLNVFIGTFISKIPLTYSTLRCVSEIGMFIGNEVKMFSFGT